jgi:hypothetical protein
VSTPAHGACDVPGYIAALGREGELLAAGSAATEPAGGAAPEPIGGDRAQQPA